MNIGLVAQVPQGTLDLEITLRDNQGKPMADTDVEFLEVNSRKRFNIQTDSQGKIKYLFKEGRLWQMNVLDIRNYEQWQVEVVPGKQFTMTRVITYDYNKWERETRPAVDRKPLGLVVESQKFQPDVAPTTGNGVIKLEIKKANDAPLSNFPVDVTCYKLKKTFRSSTNPAGIVTFVVPLANEYEVDIDGIPSYTYVDLPNRPGVKMSKGFTYEPTVVNEKTVRDTTTQVLPDNQEGTTGRVLVKVVFKGGPNGVWRGEPVFLEVLGEKRVYKGATNQSGEVRFLLPKGKKYMVRGRFQPDIDVVDLSRRRGIGYLNKTVTYRPVEKYQYPDRFIPTPENLLTTAFDLFLSKQFKAPTAGQAFAIDGQWMQNFHAESQDAVLRIALTGGNPPDISKAPPLNLALVVDKSGSMAGDDRIGNLIKSLVAFVNRLRPDDIVSLVVFDDFEEVLYPAKPVGTDKSKLINTILRIEADNGTQIAQGLKAGYTELMKNYKTGRVNRLILLSDGYGSEPVEETTAAAKPFTAKGAECTAVGVGPDYNVPLLNMLATTGGGVVEHVGDPTQLESVFLNQIGSVLYPVAKDLELEVLFGKSLEYKQLYGFPLVEKGAGRLRLKMKNMFSGLNQLAFLRFRVIEPRPGIQDEPVTIKAKYKDAVTGQPASLEQKVPLIWEPSSGNLEFLFDANERKMYAIAVMNQSLKVMADEFKNQNPKAAHQALMDGLQTLSKVFPDAKDEDLSALKEEMERYLDILSKQF
jgi:Ca-activated chloride channel family protein